MKKLEQELGEIKNVEGGVVIDLCLSYGAVMAWQEMIDLAKKRSPQLAATRLGPGAACPGTEPSWRSITQCNP